MNMKDYQVHLEGYAAAALGSGLSDAPHGGRRGDLWRGGVRVWLDEHEADAAAPDAALGSIRRNSHIVAKCESRKV